MSRLLVIGVGLIGGSFAGGARDAGLFAEVIGADADADNLARAQQLGLINQSLADWQAAIPNVDAVLVAVPPGVVVNVLSQVFQAGLPDHALVFDATSTKSSVVSGLQRELAGLPANFVPVHPMAGSELQGPAAARPDLYQNSQVFLTPTTDTAPDAVAKVRSWWEQLGASCHEIDAAQHDAMAALSSHLPHLLASAYMAFLGTAARREGVTDDTKPHTSSTALTPFAGPGLRDFSRIAAAEPTLWRDIFAANRHLLLDELDELLVHLGRIRAELAAEQDDALVRMLTDGRDLRRQLARHLPNWRADSD